MASSGQIKGITIKIEGDTSDLAKNLTTVNKSISQTSKALKDVEKALKLDPGNVELLEQKQQLLNKQIEQTQEKLELERQAGEDAKEALDIGSISQEEYATLAAEITNTEASLKELQTSAEGSADGLEETGEAAEEAGDSAEDSASSFEGWGAIVSASAKAAAAAVAAVASAAVAAGTALVNTTVETAHYADEVNTLSTITGVSTDTLQAMNYATELLDVSTEQMTGAMTKLVKGLDSAASGSGATAEAYAALGVTVTDANGELRSSEDVFWDVIDALGEIDNETERDAAAMELLGRSARDLNPLIEAGSEGFQELADQAQESGYIMSGDTLDAFQEFDDNLQLLNNGATAAKNAIGTVLLPILTQLSSDGVDFLSDFTNAILDTNGDVEAMGGVIEEMIPQAIAIIQTYLPMLVELAGTLIESVAGALIENLPMILSAATELVLSIAQGIVETLPELAPVIADLVVNLATFIIENLPMIIDAAIQIVLAVVNGISNNLDKLIPATVQAILTIVNALLNNFPQIIEAAFQLIVALANGLISALPELASQIPQIVETIINGLSTLATDLPNMARQWGSDLISNFANAITQAIPNLIAAASSAAQSVADFLHFSEPERGPLSDFNQSGGDMIDNFIKSMKGEEYNLKTALNQTANVIYTGMTGTDYSGALSGISSQLAGLAVPGGPSVINVYVGRDRLATAVINAQAQEDYRAGGI